MQQEVHGFVAKLNFKSIMILSVVASHGGPGPITHEPSRCAYNIKASAGSNCNILHSRIIDLGIGADAVGGTAGALDASEGRGLLGDDGSVDIADDVDGSIHLPCTNSVVPRRLWPRRPDSLTWRWCRRWVTGLYVSATYSLAQEMAKPSYG